MLGALVLQQLKILHEIHVAHHTVERFRHGRIMAVHVQLQSRLTDVRFLAQRTVERIRIAMMLNVIQQHRTLEELLAATPQIAGLLVLQRIVIDRIAKHRKVDVAQFAFHRKVLPDADVLRGDFVGRVLAPRFPRNGRHRFVGCLRFSRGSFAFRCRCASFCGEFLSLRGLGRFGRGSPSFVFATKRRRRVR